MTIRKLIVTKKRAEFATSAHILADQVLTCSPQVVVQVAVLLIFRAKTEVQLTRELGRTQFSQIRVLR